jgi:ABC-type lipoprotein release transport system permease subunit
VASGSALWRTTADDVGVISNVTVPLLVLAAVAATTVALASLVGVVPARRAANVPAAPTLRAE